eukprot:1648201-Prorocentrum_lima.AAC.1
MVLGIAGGTSDNLTIRSNGVSARWSGLALAFSFSPSFAFALPFQEGALFLTDLDVIVRTVLAAQE